MAKAATALERGDFVLDYMQVLRLLTINDEHVSEEAVRRAASPKLPPKTLSLVRIAALVAVGGAVPSYGAEVDAAISAGASADEIVEVLLDIVSVVGLPCVVTAAPNLALALGYDMDDVFEEPSAR